MLCLGPGTMCVQLCGQAAATIPKAACKHILVLLSGYKLRAPPDRRLAMRHRSAGKVRHGSPVRTLPLLSVHNYKYTKPR